MGFNWGGMERTPEANLIKGQKDLTFEELTQKSDAMARNIMASPKLLSEVKVNIQKLLSGTTIEERESLGAEIASRHPEAIPDTMEDRRAQAALVLRVAELVDEKRRHLH